MSNWIKIPGYPYWISQDGTKVKNQKGHILKPIPMSGGLGYELRQCGQRDKLSLKDLQMLVELEVTHESA